MNTDNDETAVAEPIVTTQTAPKSKTDLATQTRRQPPYHVIILNERHLRRILRTYLAYYHRNRTHFGLSKDAPDGRPACAASGPILVSPEVGGLHHRYDRQAA